MVFTRAEKVRNDCKQREILLLEEEVISPTAKAEAVGRWSIIETGWPPWLYRGKLGQGGSMGRGVLEARLGV